jgi:Arc/MetJ-type ribon-helix-helix transcriptional regulator
MKDSGLEGIDVSLGEKRSITVELPSNALKTIEALVTLGESLSVEEFIRKAVTDKAGQSMRAVQAMLGVKANGKAAAKIPGRRPHR